MREYGAGGRGGAERREVRREKEDELERATEGERERESGVKRRTERQTLSSSKVSIRFFGFRNYVIPASISRV